MQYGNRNFAPARRDLQLHTGNRDPDSRAKRLVDRDSNAEADVDCDADCDADVNTDSSCLEFAVERVHVCDELPESGHGARSADAALRLPIVVFHAAVLGARDRLQRHLHGNEQQYVRGHGRVRRNPSDL
jgi:hypothetical protein